MHTLFSTGTLPLTRFLGPWKNRLEDIELVDIDGESGLSNDDQNPEIEFVEEIICHNHQHSPRVL